MLGPVEMVGNCAARLKRTAARASRRRASAILRFWLETVSCSSRALSCGSPKVSHHLPRRDWSAGCAVFHWPASLKESGGCSLKLAEVGAEARTYLGPTSQPESTTATVTARNGRRDFMD